MKKLFSAVTAMLLTAGSLMSTISASAKETNTIDNFDSYANNEDLLKSFSVNESGDSLKLSLADNSENGSNALQYEYSLGDVGYSGAKKSINNQDWSSYDGISFLINSNGTGDLTTIQFKDAKGILWECSKTFTKSGWTEAEIPFSDFKIASGESAKADKPDLSSVSEFSIIANKGSSSAVTTTTSYIGQPTTTTTTKLPVVIGSDNSMHVSGGKLYDGDGNEFIMRGVNLPHDWYTEYTEQSINAVADLGANTVRIVLGEGSKYPKTSKDELVNIINWSKARGLVCVLEIHDFTGSNSASDITVNAVNYWKEMMDVINANKDYVIVNIANEWQGTWDMGSLWADTYKTAIKSLRDAGLETAIMVDASGYGQESTAIVNDCKSVLAADEDSNTIFSYHVYSVLGESSDRIKSSIDAVTNQDVCLVIGEYGWWQNFGDVDEKYLVDYCEDQELGWLAWSWKGNGGYDNVLDMTNDWGGKDLTEWGKWVFGYENGIQATAKMAYTGETYSGTRITPEADHVANTPLPTKPDIIIQDDVAVPAGALDDYDWTWVVNADPDKPVSETTIEELENGGFRAYVDLEKENYPTLNTLNSDGYDLSGHKTIDLVVRNNNASAVQINLVMKAGSAYKWYEPNTPSSYINVPGGMTQLISFDITAVGADLADVKQISFRIQPSSGEINNPIDICSMGFDLAADTYTDEISEMNRPKSANSFTWSYPETSFEGTVSTDLSSDGVITVNFKDITDQIGAGVQTETRPGVGEGMDFTNYSGIKATLSNESANDVHATIVVKNGSNWTWAENGGSLTPDGMGGEMIIPAGESVDVYYNLTQASWKSMTSAWQYTGTLTELDDVRAIAFKIYTGSGESATGTVKISNFEVLGKNALTNTASFTDLAPIAADPQITVAAPEPKAASTGMYIEGNSLYTADGKEFIMRGINIAHTWFKNDTITAINKSAEYGSNATRIVLSDDSYAANGWQGYKDDVATVEKLIQECKKNGQVAIVEYHNGTGGDDTKYVDSAVAYWLEMVDMLNKYTDCCIVNILNEWQGTWNLSTYAPTYQNAIKTLRNAGMKNVIMIDAPGWGQDAGTMYNNAPSILAADPDGNTMFSIHMYAVAGADANTVKSNIDNTLAQGVCLVIGEFGCNHKMSGQIYDVAYQTIMDYSQEKNVGWLAWSWCGNGSDDYFLDLVTDQAGNTLTSWGDSIVNGKNGIKETSVKLNEQPAPTTYSIWYFDDIALYKNDKPETTTAPSTDPTIIYGDADESGEVNINDAVRVMSFVTNSTQYPLSAKGYDNADVNTRGDGISNMDALSIQKYLANMITELPESFAA